MTKPVVNIRDCYIYADSQGRERLAGVPIDYPDTHKIYYFKDDNESVITSPIVSKNQNTIETVRTIYNVQNWADDDTTT